jgi:hypothetical protein
MTNHCSSSLGHRSRSPYYDRQLGDGERRAQKPQNLHPASLDSSDRHCAGRGGRMAEKRRKASKASCCRHKLSRVRSSSKSSKSFCWSAGSLAILCILCITAPPTPPSSPAPAPQGSAAAPWLIGRGPGAPRWLVGWAGASTMAGLKQLR